MKRSTRTIFLAFTIPPLAFSLLACEGGGGDGFLTIGSGGSAGTFYAYAGAFADVLNSELSDTSANAEETGGSVENIRLVAQGDSDLGIAQADAVSDALAGDGDFDEPVDVRVLGAIYPNYLQLATTSASGRQTFADLAGATISVGPAGGGQEVTLRTVTEALGYSYDHFGSVQNLGFGDQNQAFGNGQIEVGNYMTALGAGTLIEITSSDDMTFIDFSQDELDTIIAEEPYFSRGSITQDTYDGVTEDIDVPALWNYIVVPADMDEDLAYELATALYEHAGTVEAAVPQAAETVLDNVAEIAAPLHPGAARYFDEAGIDIPDAAQPTS